jgi:hypothetical protein
MLRLLRGVVEIGVIVECFGDPAIVDTSANQFFQLCNPHGHHIDSISIAVLIRSPLSVEGKE